ncbi:MAG TPA: acyl-CoA thioesterase [Chitinophagaceae bacterium]|nr:acyl-CoA thioesterase [Chitinophagaceae bacterium]
MQLQSFYTIRFSDCDPFGHLNNARYIDYMLNAREDHLREHLQLGLDSFYKQGIGWVVTGHEILYIRPANYNERVCIQSDLIEAGDSNLLVEMRMLDETGSTLKAIMWSKFTCVNIKTGKRENHTPGFMEVLKEWVVTDINVSDGLKARLMSRQAV